MAKLKIKSEGFKDPLTEVEEETMDTDGPGGLLLMRKNKNYSDASSDEPDSSEE